MDLFDPAAVQQRSVQGQIFALEASQMRAVREFILGDASAIARLKAINDQIVALRAQLTP